MPASLSHFCATAVISLRGESVAAAISYKLMPCRVLETIAQAVDGRQTVSLL